jgi:VWFA-related protein
MRRSTFVAIALLVASGLLRGPGATLAQEDPLAPSITINQVDATGYPAVRVVATALDGRGLPVPGLASFDAIEGATTAMTVERVEAARDEQLQLSAVIVIDASGSMEGAPIAAAKDAAARFVASLGPRDEAAVVAFAADVRTVVGFTSDKAALAQGIAGLQAAGDTALYEAVSISAFAAVTRDAPRKAVVLLSDGQNDTTVYTRTAADSIAAGRGARLPVYTIGLGNDVDAPYLGALAAESGGEYLPADSANVGAVYARVADLLRNQYVLTLRAAGDADGTDSTVTITAEIAGQRVSSRASTFPRGTAPPVAPTNVPAQEPAPAADTAGGGNSSATAAAIVVGVLLVVAVVAGVAAFVVRLRNQQRVEEAQLAAVAPNAALASAQGVPALRRKPFVPSGPREATPARLVSLDGSADGAVVFGREPLVLGSSLHAGVRIAAAADVAPVHALVWVKDGKIMLRHAGGGARRTSVDGRPIDWVILEDGDVFAIGTHRYRVEQERGAVPAV